MKNKHFTSSLDDEQEIEEIEELKERYNIKKIFNDGYTYKKPSAYRDDIKIKDIIDLREKKMTYKKISEKLKCSPSTIKNRIDELMSDDDKNVVERMILEDCLNKDYSLREIADAIDCAPSRVKNKILKHGLKYPDFNDKDEEFDLFDEEYYNDIKVKAEEKQKQAQQNKTEKRGRSRKDIDMGEVYRLRGRGYSYDKIAEELKCSPNTIKNRLKNK